MPELRRHLCSTLPLFLLTASAFGGTINNGSFETGDLTYWDSSGAASVVTASFGTGPTDGVFQAFLSTGTGASSSVTIANFLGVTIDTLHAMAAPQRATQGSVIKQDIVASAGDVLSFDWNFLTNEATPNSVNNDLGFWMLLPAHSGLVLADTFSTFVASSTSFFEETGFFTTSYTFSSGGTFTLVFGVMDVDPSTGTTIDSGLLIDNVRITASVIPEPPAFLLFFAGSACGLLRMSRERRRATRLSLAEQRGKPVKVAES